MLYRDCVHTAQPERLFVSHPQATQMLLQLYLPSHWSVVATPTQRYYALCAWTIVADRPEMDVVSSQPGKRKKKHVTHHTFGRASTLCYGVTVLPMVLPFPTLEGNACFSYLASKLLGSMGNPTHTWQGRQNTPCVSNIIHKANRLPTPKKACVLVLREEAENSNLTA